MGQLRRSLFQDAALALPDERSDCLRWYSGSADRHSGALRLCPDAAGFSRQGPRHGPRAGGLLVPYHVTAIPLFLGLSQLHLLDSYAALILPFIASVFGIFLFRQFFATIPKDLIDAARIDGLSEVSIVWRIAFPLAWPASTAFAVFSIVAHWNDLFWPLIATSSPDLATPPRGILLFRDVESGSSFGPLMAAATIVTAPLIAVFLMAQRAFIQGLTMTGLKG